MSTSPEAIRTGDRVVRTISRWLVRRRPEKELRAELDAVDLTRLGPSQVEAVHELQDDLAAGAERPDLEAISRETFDTVAPNVWRAGPSRQAVLPACGRSSGATCRSLCVR